MQEEFKENILKEPGALYASMQGLPKSYINPFEDWAFKKIFASESSVEVTKAFLNALLEGKREIKAIEFGKNEYPGETIGEGGAVFDFVCTDIHGVTFLVEVQRQEQQYFKERSLFYASRLMSDQAPKGDKGWKYNLKEVYSISLLEKFTLPGTSPDKYLHKVSLCNVETGEIFYDKLHFIYVEMTKFDKKEMEFESELDRWLYALKYSSEMTEEPQFFKAPELKQFFYLANYANLTTEERKMYRTAQQVRWDNQNVRDFELQTMQVELQTMQVEIETMRVEIETARAAEKKMYKEELLNIVKALLADGISVSQVLKYTRLSEEEVIALK